MPLPVQAHFYCYSVVEKCHFCHLKKAAPLFEDILVLYIFYFCLYIVKHFEHM